MAGDDAADDLVELRPARSVLLRHRSDTDLTVDASARPGPRVELRRGPLWVRAGEDGPGVTIVHGAASVQVRAGAGVIEVNDLEALVVVASGRAAVKGVAPLPRSVVAGQAVALTLDGTFTDPAPLTAAELAADRMVVENLARDNLMSAVAPRTAAASDAVDPAPPPPVEVDPAPPPEVEPEPEPETEPEPEPEPEPAPEPEPEVEPAPPVGPGPGPAGAQVSALESALAGVGVTDDPQAERVAASSSPSAAEPVAAPAEDDGRRRARALVALVVVALLVFALVAALVLGGG